MEMDLKTCSRARMTRDARFDGRIFIGVVTTGIYCRPICPTPHSKEKNVQYFASAAAAAEAGFRPCLRCRPECSPGTPAWMGSSATVSRALRLISESPLEDGGLDGLASRLGVSSRHLRRLFVQHLGAPPSQMVQTRRCISGEERQRMWRRAVGGFLTLRNESANRLHSPSDDGE